MYNPILAVTMGDPAGIGPEITAKILAKKNIYDVCRPFILGDANVMKEAVRITNTNLEINSILSPRAGKYAHGTVDMLDFGNIDMKELRRGTISAMCGRAAGEYIKKAIELALNEEVDATVTNPIHKESFILGGWGKKYPGHTEMYADLTNTKSYTMLLAHGNFRTVHVSTHVSLLEAIQRVKKERVLEVIKIADQACKDFGIPAPRIGVAGLNPHASDGGTFGEEEANEILPAITAARADGINAEGPVPADTIYCKARGGWYDIVVSMYHDQGHIPMKFSGFVWNQEKNEWSNVSGINVTLGLPIIRTSVDHGTAFGKAGKGTARENSLEDAIMAAIQFAKVRAAKKNNKPAQD